jgi:hypothetical protein
VSTLPDELFHRFGRNGGGALATGFQNLLYEHPAFPADLHREIDGWCGRTARRSAGRRERDAVHLQDAQEGPGLQATLWELPTSEIIAAQEAKIGFLMTSSPSGHGGARRALRAAAGLQSPDPGRRACARLSGAGMSGLGQAPAASIAATRMPSARSTSSGVVTSGGMIRTTCP